MNTPKAEAMPAAGEYIVRVDYRSGGKVDSVSLKVLIATFECGPAMPRDKTPVQALVTRAISR